MKEELKELGVNSGLMIIGIYGRAVLGNKKYSWKQILALLLVGIGVVYVLHISGLKPIYQTSISLVAGLIMPNIISVIIKAANKSEDKTADKLSDKIDKLT